MIKTVKQQLKEELRTAISERKRLLDLRNRSDLSKNDKLALAFATTQPSLASSLIKGRSETDLKAALSSAYLDPNTTNVSNLLTAQSNDYSFLNSRSSNYLADDNIIKKDNVNSLYRAIGNDHINKYTSSSLPGLEFNYHDDRNSKNFKFSNYRLKNQKSSDNLKLHFSGNDYGFTETTTYTNSPINPSNYNSTTFSDQYIKNKLEINLKNQLNSMNLKETTIQDTNDLSRLFRASTSLSQSIVNPLRNDLRHLRSYSTANKWNRDQDQNKFQNSYLDDEFLDLKTTKFSNLDFMQNNLSNCFYDTFNTTAMKTTSNDQDGKNYLFE